MNIHNGNDNTHKYSTEPPEPEPELLTVPEVAKILRISEKTVYAEVARGHVPSLRFGRKIRIPRHALMRLVRGDAAGYTISRASS